MRPKGKAQQTLKWANCGIYALLFGEGLVTLALYWSAQVPLIREECIFPHWAAVWAHM